MLLQNKNAIIYGGGGSLGGAVAKAFAYQGARIFLTGRRIDSIEKTAKEIADGGGKVETSIVDALEASAIKKHMESVLQKAGKVDISFNAIGIDVKQDVPLIELGESEFVDPITSTMRTQFLTATEAGRAMKLQQSGVILFLTATPGGIGYPYTGGFAAACCALECFSRNLGSELGFYGVRVVTMRSGGSPDSRIFAEAIKAHPELMKHVLSKMEDDTMLKKLPVMADIADAAVFLASDRASKITGTTIDLTAGTTSALNYRSVRVFDDNPDLGLTTL